MDSTDRWTPADTVTAIRAVLSAAVALSLVVGWPQLPGWAWWVALTAWLLDGVDGIVARRTGRITRHGARFDMETDAALLMILSVAAAPGVGWWVLAIGAMRYLFWVAQLIWTCLRAPLAFSQARRVIAAIQGGALLTALVTPSVVAIPAVAVALFLLIGSFGRDVIRLVRTHD